MKTQILLLVSCMQLVSAGSMAKNSACNSGSCGTSGTCSSASCLTVSWTEVVPYSYLKDNHLSGIIPDLLDTLLDKCCGSCWNVNVTTAIDLQSLPRFPNSSDVVLPFYLESKEQSYRGMKFIPLVDTPSVVYITKRQSTGGIPKKLLAAIWDSWPVLIIALLMSLLAGVLLWFLEMWHNQEEFPPTFLKGSWEGFWWAFVSMTTVGYGDRAPKSFLGRGFAIFWILIGICICSVFTATLTTALTTISLEDVKTINRAKAGAIRNSLEAIIGVKSQAKVIPYNTSDQLWTALWNGRVDGVLLDSYLSATPTLSSRIKDDDLKISQTVESEGWSYGFLMRDSTLAECLKNELQVADTNLVPETIGDEIESEEDEENEATKRSASIFDPTGDLFYPSLYACIGLTVVMVATGLLWEFVWLVKCGKQSRTDCVEASRNPGNAPNLDNMEKEMLSEVQRLFATWREKMVQIGKEGPMEMVELDERL